MVAVNAAGVIIIIIVIITIMLTTLFHMALLHLNQRRSPTPGLQVPHCSTFHIMCDVPNCLL